MIYGHNKTIHSTRKLNIEVDKDGNVVSVWFRCCALPFDVTEVGSERASEMRRMSESINKVVKLNAVDVEHDEDSTRSAKISLEVAPSGPAIEGHEIAVVKSITPEHGEV